MNIKRCIVAGSKSVLGNGNRPVELETRRTAYVTVDFAAFTVHVQVQTGRTSPDFISPDFISPFISVRPTPSQINDPTGRLPSLAQSLFHPRRCTAMMLN